MQVLNQPQITYKPLYVPSFKSSLRGDCITDILRPDMDWKAFVNMLVKKYKKAEKVNIYVGGCADGSEAYQTAMLLIRKLGKKEAQKFFPIKAWDIDAKILQNPKDGVIKVTKKDIERLEKYTGKDYLEYIHLNNKFVTDAESGIAVCTGKIKSILKDTVIFEKRDFTKNIPNIQRNNSVLMCRNVWPYFSEKEQPKLAQALFDRLGDNSMFIAGEYELGSGLNHLFLDKGFEVFDWLGISPCYVKSSSNVQSHLSNPEYLKAVYANTK